ncbi:uncharacterized protein LOC127576467 [Pristis pectinata]|uniref:uncharacterized protein LOC127576467 n=1 Tax=Pristis pectinata TaxID=685728 RepID=UPI00223DFD25|nr:uncharacterized protein LOC127576467 [Pristis pectinata]
MGILVVFTLCLCLRRTFSQSVTQSPTALTRQECQSLTITCSFQTGYFSSSYDFQTGYFFKQTQSGTEWQRISSGGRVALSNDKAKMTFTLEIRDLRVEDSATYYCKAEYKCGTDSGITVHKWKTYYEDGTGSTVTVTADPISLVSRNPPAQSSSAGGTITLSCEYFGFCPYTVYWYRQFPGQPPKFLLRRHTSGEQDKNNAAEGRISGSLDPAKKISQLTVIKLQLSDSALYHCAISRRTAQ